MTENTTAPDETIGIALHANLRSGDGETISLRQVALGHRPMALMEIDMDASTEDTMVVMLDTTGFDPAELADFLRAIADVVDQAAAAGALTMIDDVDTGDDEDDEPSED